jgi:hypothetical protein
MSYTNPPNVTNNPPNVIGMAGSKKGENRNRQRVHIISLIIYVRPNSMTVLCFVFDVRFSDIYTAHQQTTTCFKIVFFQTFLEFFSRNFKMRGDGNHDDRHDDDRHDDDEQV